VAKGGDELAGGHIPKPGGSVFACRRDPCTIGAERSVINISLMFKGGDELAGSRLPKFGGSVRARRQDPVPSGLNAAELTSSW